MAGGVCKQPPLLLQKGWGGGGREANTGSFVVDSGITRGVVFVDVGLFPGLCGFVLVVPPQQNTRCVGQSDPQLISWREGLTKEKHNNNQNPKTYTEPI